MYQKLKSAVKCGNGSTDYFDCTVGTRQGCVTSPIIFFSFLFITDLINYEREKCSNDIFLSDEIEDLLALKYADFADIGHALQRLINWT